MNESRTKGSLWWAVAIGVLVWSSWAGAVTAEVTGEATGFLPDGVVCRNLTTGQTVLSTTSLLDWSCEALGLELSPGDRVETGVRGRLPSEEGAGRLDVGSLLLPEDFSAEFVSDLPAASHVGDFDGDGDLDLLGTIPLAWFENLGGAIPTFATHDLQHLISVGVGVSDAHVVDADGDGRLDFVASNRAGAEFDRLSLFRNNGEAPPTFSRIDILFEQGWDFSHGEPADVDGDGDVDFFLARREVIGCGFDCAISLIWLENGEGNTWIEHLVEAAAGTVDLLSLDVDSDGDLDLATVSSSVLWFENEGGVFAQSHDTPISLGHVFELARSDLDQDGDADLIGRTIDEEVLWIENIGEGASFAVHVVYALQEFSVTESLAVADLTRDGLDDLVFFNEATPVWLEHLGGSPPAFREHPLVVTRASSFGISSRTGDIDQDGRPDLVGTAFLTDLNDWVSVWYANRVGRRLSVGGMSVKSFSCRNRTTGQTLRVPASGVAIDCENEGLMVGQGDEVEVFARGLAE